MRFETANIWQDFNTTSRTEYGTLDDNANEVILGPRLNHAVRDLANGYNKRLGLASEHKATDERAKLLDLHWGRIEHDGAMLQGLGVAMTNFTKVLGDNVAALQERWQGASYDAFKAAIDKVQATVGAYGEAATITGQSLIEAMTQTRQMYQKFADDSADTHLNFEDDHGHGYSPPKEWHKVPSDGYRAKDLADACPTWHSIDLYCQKDHPEQQTIIAGRWVTERRWEICKNDPCETNAGRVNIMYGDMVDECQKAIDRIKGKLNSYYGAVKTVVDGVSKLYDAALSNVDNLAKDQVFTTLRVVGGQPTGGGTPGGGDPGGYPVGGGSYPVDGGGYPADTGGSPGDADPGPAAVAEPEPAPAEAPADTPSPDTVAQAADQQEGVQIQDGDRTIGVTSPDGEGHVRVTVQDAAGTTKTYELDFDAASGRSGATPPETGEPGSDEAAPEQIAARTDGKCVIQDGELTITAERPLFSPDSIKLVVDDGTGTPATYTVDFDGQDTAPQQPDAATPQATPATEAEADPAAGGTTTEASPAEPNGSPVTTADQPADAPAPAERADATGPTTPQLTSPQAAWHDQAGSVSGVLDPAQHHSGEAELAKAPDADRPEVGGTAGAGLPFLGAPTGGAGHEGVRTGAGWSVHGDLFDNGEPVYSMHGVLGDDDGTAE